MNARRATKGRPFVRAARQVRRITTEAIESSESRPPPGSRIFVFNHRQKNHVVYSLTEQLSNARALRQIPFNGKKTVPSVLRKDLWTPFAEITFPADSAATGLSAYRILREYRRRHELEWGDEITKNEKGYFVNKKVRGRLIADQRANTVADMAAVFARLEAKAGLEAEEVEGQEKNNIGLAGEGTGKKVKVLWSDILNAEFAETWSENVEHGVMPTSIKPGRMQLTAEAELAKAQEEGRVPVEEDGRSPQERELDARLTNLARMTLEDLDDIYKVELTGQSKRANAKQRKLWETLQQRSKDEILTEILQTEPYSERLESVTRILQKVGKDFSDHSQAKLQQGETPEQSLQALQASKSPKEKATTEYRTDRRVQALERRLNSRLSNLQSRTLADLDDLFRVQTSGHLKRATPEQRKMWEEIQTPGRKEAMIAEVLQAESPFAFAEGMLLMLRGFADKQAEAQPRDKKLQSLEQQLNNHLSNLASKTPADLNDLHAGTSSPRKRASQEQRTLWEALQKPGGEGALTAGILETEPRAELLSSAKRMLFALRDFADEPEATQQEQKERKKELRSLLLRLGRVELDELTDEKQRAIWNELQLKRKDDVITDLICAEQAAKEGVDVPTAISNIREVMLDFTDEEVSRRHFETKDTKRQAWLDSQETGEKKEEKKEEKKGWF